MHISHRMPVCAREAQPHLLACAAKGISLTLVYSTAAGAQKMLWMLVLYNAANEWCLRRMLLHKFLYPALQETSVSKVNAVASGL